MTSVTTFFGCLDIYSGLFVFSFLKLFLECSFLLYNVFTVLHTFSCQA